MARFLIFAAIMPDFPPKTAPLPYDAAVLIGRFQPFHKGHAALLSAAFGYARQVVLVLGSAFRSRNIKNPFTWEERVEMIRATLSQDEAARLIFIPLKDYYHLKTWVKALEEEVRLKTAACRVALIGFHKDASSNYLCAFPDWDFIAQEKKGEINATMLRQAYFGGESREAALSSIWPYLPKPVARYLESWSRLPVYEALREEYRALMAIPDNLRPPTAFYALMTLNKKVFLTCRRAAPGKGLWALPGFLSDDAPAQGKTLPQGLIPKLREETGLDIPDALMENAFRNVTVFDHPERSGQGRVTAYVYRFDMAASSKIPGGKPSPEIVQFPIADLPELESACFEDHFHILHQLLLSGLTEKN